MILDQFKQTAPMPLPGCLECGKPLTDLSIWGGQERVIRWRCVKPKCRLSIFKPVNVPSFQQMRMI